MSLSLRPIAPGLLMASLGLPAFAQAIDPNAPSQFNWNQTTGLINIPIARAMKRGTFFGAFDFKSRRLQNLFGSEFLGGAGDQGNGSFHLMFSPIRNVELGIMGLHDVPRGGDVNTLDRLLKIPPAQDFSTALKVVLAEETLDMPGFAIGVENLTYPYPASNDALPTVGFRQPGYYAVASKSIPVGDQLLSAHLGFGTGRFQNRPFGGLEFTFENGLALLAEYDGWQGAFGLRYTGLRNLRLTAAVQGGQPTFQVGYMFNPFDLFSDGDQYDYSPYAIPGQELPSSEEPAGEEETPLEKSDQLVEATLRECDRVSQAPRPVVLARRPAAAVTSPPPVDEDPEFLVRKNAQPVTAAVQAPQPPTTPVAVHWVKPVTPVEEPTARVDPVTTPSPQPAPQAIAGPVKVIFEPSQPTVPAPPRVEPAKMAARPAAPAHQAALKEPKTPTPVKAKVNPTRPVVPEVALVAKAVKPTVKVVRPVPVRRVKAHDDDAREFGQSEDLAGYSRPSRDQDDF